MKEALAPLVADGAYVYDVPFLHVTTASLLAFPEATRAYRTPEAQAEVERAIVAAMERECTAEQGFPTRAFPLVYESVSLGDRAAILRLADPTGSVAAIRSCVARLRADPELERLGVFDPEHGNFKIPNIVHSTFLRFVAEPRDPAAFRARFDDVAQRWTPVTVWATSIAAVRESVPFMHLDVTDPAAIAWSRAFEVESEAATET